MTTSFFLHSLVFLYFIQLPVLSSGFGFTVDLFHRDSPLSPLYDATKTISDRVKRDLHISNSRAAYFRELSSKSTQEFEAKALPTGAGYIIVSSIGSPPTQFLGEIDTGSDLTWTQCSPCDNCYNQKAPFFDPTKSSTYNSQNCSSPFCKGPYFFCSSNDPKKCSYQVSYGDLSFSEGDAAAETFTFGSTSVPGLVFGCGHADQGTFSNISTGLIGLGGGEVSFPSQMKEMINGKFSYCFGDSKSNASGKISFGDDALVSGPEVVSTPLVPGNINTFYQLTFDSVKIGDKTIPVPERKDGNIIIDSGTTLTFLPDTMVDDIESEVKQSIKGTPIPDPLEFFELCYDLTTTKLDGGPITFMFDGAQLEVPLSSAFFEVVEGVSCLGIGPESQAGYVIFGNMLQMNFQVTYDLIGKKVSFKKTDCSQQ